MMRGSLEPSRARRVVDEIVLVDRAAERARRRHVSHRYVGPEVAAASGVLTAGRVGDHVRMFAPSPQQGGSSVSHFDTALSPNEPMEPIYTGPRHTLGLTVSALQDMGWPQSTPAIV